jgi:hypothetical protein
MKSCGQDEITRFFRQVVAAVNEAVVELDIGDQAAWDLARKLHARWREALRRAHTAPPPPEPPSHGHPAMEDLLQMIDLEGGE